MVGTPSAVPAASVLLDSSTSSTASSNGTAITVQGSESSSISGGVVGEERLVDLPPAAAEANWVEVQKRKKFRGDGRVCMEKGFHFSGCIDRTFGCFQPSGVTTKDSGEVRLETEELDFQFDDYGGKMYNFSDPLAAQPE